MVTWIWLVIAAAREVGVGVADCGDRRSIPWRPLIVLPWSEECEGSLESSRCLTYPVWLQLWCSQTGITRHLFS